MTLPEAKSPSPSTWISACERLSSRLTLFCATSSASSDSRVIFGGGGGSVTGGAGIDGAGGRGFSFNHGLHITRNIVQLCINRVGLGVEAHRETGK